MRFNTFTLRCSRLITTFLLNLQKIPALSGSKVRIKEVRPGTVIHKQRPSRSFDLTSMKYIGSV